MESGVIARCSRLNKPISGTVNQKAHNEHGNTSNPKGKHW
jgi:hypothetical protein